MSATWGRGKVIRPVFVEGASAYVPFGDGTAATIDADDVALVAARNWHSTGPTGWSLTRYAISTWPQPAVLMHRLILGLGPGAKGHGPGDVVVDHRDGDGLNNRRENIRAVTHVVNIRNRHWFVEE